MSWTQSSPVVVRQVSCVVACTLEPPGRLTLFNRGAQIFDLQYSIRTYLARKMIQGIIIRRNIKMDKYTDVGPLSIWGQIW